MSSLEGLSLKHECEARNKRESAENKKKNLRTHLVTISSSSSERSVSRDSRRNRKRSHSSRRSRSRERDGRKKSRSKIRRRSSSSSTSSSSSRSGSRRRSRKKSRSEHRDRSRRSRTPSTHRGDLTSSSDPKHVARRVFIGNVPSDKMLKTDFESIFKKYGRILCITMKKGYAFVQFQHKEDALNAVRSERGCSFSGYRLDIKMAGDGRDGKKETVHERLPPPSEFSFFHGPGGPRPPPPPFMGGYPPVNPYFAGCPPYRMDYPPMYGRGPLDQYGRPPPLEDDPSRVMTLGPLDLYRRRTYDDDGRPSDDLRSRSPSLPIHPIRSTDCEIVVLNEKQRAYADGVHKALKKAGLVIEVNFLPVTVEVGKAIEIAAGRRLAFVVIVGEENELHRSMTVNILHGQPEEHRNMPLDDAIALVVRSFELYRKTLPAEKKIEFIPPDRSTLYLLNLLTDNRYVTTEELRQVIEYLEDRNDRLIESHGGVPPKRMLPVNNKGELSQDSTQSQKPLSAPVVARQPLMDTPPRASAVANAFTAQYSQSTAPVQPVSVPLREPLQRAAVNIAQYASDMPVTRAPLLQQPLASYGQAGNSHSSGGADLRNDSQPLIGERYPDFNAPLGARPGFSTPSGLRPSLVTKLPGEMQRDAGPVSVSDAPYPGSNALLGARPPLSMASPNSTPGSSLSVAGIMNNKSINFDNPMVKNALDNLISSGANNLFKNFTGALFQAKPTAIAGGGDQNRPGQERGELGPRPNIPVGIPNAGTGSEKGSSYADWDKFISNVREHPEKY